MQRIEADASGVFTLEVSFTHLGTRATEIVSRLPPFASLEDYRAIGQGKWIASQVPLPGGVVETLECRRMKLDIRLTTRELVVRNILGSIESGLVALLSRPCPASLILREHDGDRRAAILRSFSPWALVSIPSSGVSDYVRLASSDRELLTLLGEV